MPTHSKKTGKKPESLAQQLEDARARIATLEDRLRAATEAAQDVAALAAENERLGFMVRFQRAAMDKGLEPAWVDRICGYLLADRAEAAARAIARGARSGSEVPQ
jgi:hypothetical protein